MKMFSINPTSGRGQQSWPQKGGELGQEEVAEIESLAHARLAVCGPGMVKLSSTSRPFSQTFGARPMTELAPHIEKIVTQWYPKLGEEVIVLVERSDGHL